MDITGETRTELIELVRATRAIVDTGWPRATDSTPEIAQMENFLRANLVNTVASNLFYMAGRDEADRPGPPRAVNELIEMMRESNEHFRAQGKDIIGLAGRVAESVTAMVRLTAAVETLSEEVRAGREPEDP